MHVDGQNEQAANSEVRIDEITTEVIRGSDRLGIFIPITNVHSYVKTEVSILISKVEFDRRSHES